MTTTARAATAAKSVALNAHGGGAGKMAEGNKTTLIYSLIRDHKFAEAVKILNNELVVFPKSRAALSLLGHCYYSMQEFESAATTYEKLTKVCPDVEEYKMYYAQSLYKAGLFLEGSRAALQVTDPVLAPRMTVLQTAIKYEQDDLVASKSLADQCISEEPETIVAYGCISFKEGEYETARAKFVEAMNQLGYQPDLAYSQALCLYKTQQYELAVRMLEEIIQRGVRDHPELSVFSNTDGVDVRSVGNSGVLKETALIEAFNLKAAVEFQVKNYEAARVALSDMPPRAEKELDVVTLHNQALMNMDANPSNGFSKLNYLIGNPPCPPESFGNLLLLYCKFQCYALAADIMAEYTHLHESALSQELYEYLEALILKESSPEEAFRRFDELSTKHVETLRKLTKEIQDARIAQDNMGIRDALKDYDDALERYIPVLMAQAKIYWDIENFPMVEKIFRQSAEFASEHDIWKLNVAHIFFMQEKFKDAIRYYEPYVKKHFESILDVTAVVLANLCVAYIMTSQNEEAEELMKQIEKEEEGLQSVNPAKPSYHLCIVNLVIGTLYCAKNNYEFGISRIIKSLEPYNKKLHADTWYYAKRCFLGLAESIAKQMILFKDSLYIEITTFLGAAEEHGKNIPADPNTQLQDPTQPLQTRQVNTVTDEARILRRIFLRLYKDL